MRRYEHFGDMRDIQNYMNRMFKEFWGVSGKQLPSDSCGCSIVPVDENVQSPFVDVRDVEDNIIVTADMPGVDKEDVNISVSENTLEISTESKEEVSEEKKDEGFVRRERYYTRFYRRVPLPGQVDESSARATLNNGVLEITLPKTELEESKNRINVE